MLTIPMKPNSVCTVLVLLLALVLNRPAPVAAEPTIDPTANAAFTAMNDALKNASSLIVRASNLFDVVDPSGIKIKTGQSLMLFVKRPNMMHARVTRDDGSRFYFWYDGKRFTRYVPDLNTYSQANAPDSLDATLDWLSDEYNVNLPLADFLYAAPFEAFREYLISAEHLGVRTVDGVETDHVSVESAGVDFQIWISRSVPQLPKRFVITYIEQRAEPEFMATFENWEVDTYLDDGMFEFEPPAGAESKPLVPLAQ